MDNCAITKDFYLHIDQANQISTYNVQDEFLEYICDQHSEEPCKEQAKANIGCGKV